MTKLRFQLILALFASLLAVGVPSSTAFSAQAKPKTAASATASDAKVDLNTASEKDLVNLPGVGTATAKKIIAGRPYSSVDDLSKAGVSASTIRKITPLVTATGAPAAERSSAKASSPKTSSPVSKPSSPPPSQPTAAAAASSQPSPATSPAKSTASATTTASQGSPGAGKVWVTLDSGVYHYEGSRYYGKTKSGKYMSESDAIAAGYRAAKNEKKPQ